MKRPKVGSSQILHIQSEGVSEALPVRMEEIAKSWCLMLVEVYPRRLKDVTGATKYELKGLNTYLHERFRCLALQN